MLKKILLLILILVIAAGSFYYYKNYQKPVPPVETKELPVIRVGLTPPGSLDLIVKTINILELDKKYGFKMEYKFVQTTDAMLALLNKTVDVAAIGPTLTVKMNLEKKSIKIFAPALKLTCPFLVPKDSNIKNLSDLKGKRVGMIGKISATYQDLGIIMKKMDEDVDSYYEIVELGYAGMVPGLVKGDVDSIVGICDEVSVANLISTNDLKAVGSLEDLYKKAYGNDAQMILLGVGAREDWLKTHSQEAKAFSQAVDEALQYLKKTPDIYKNPLVVKDYKLTPENIETIAVTNDQYKNYDYIGWDQLIKNLNDFVIDAVSSKILPEQPKTEIFIKL